MTGVNLQGRLALRHRLTRSFQNLAHLYAQLLFANHQAGGRIGQASGYPYIGHALFQDPFDFAHKCFGGLGFLFAFLVGLAALVVHLVKVKLALGHILEFLILILRQVAHHPLVDSVCQEEHLDALLAENFQIRAADRGSAIVGNEIVDLVLPLFHP